MKKLLGILVLGLLLNGCANFTHDPSTYNQVFKATPDYIDIGISISMKVGPAGVSDPSTKRIAINHCTSHKKFTYAFQFDDVSKDYNLPGLHVYRFTCSKRQVYKKNYWNNYNPTKVWEKDVKKTTLASKKKTCEEIGFKPKTEASANCILRLMEIEEARLNRASQKDIAATQSLIEQEIAKKSRDQEAWKVLLGLTLGTNSFGSASSNTSSGGAACFKSSETTSGTSKICYYNCMGSTKALNISSMQICPLSANF